MSVFPDILSSPAVIRPDRFQILLEREIFFPGEVVKGNLVLRCSAPMKCRGVRLHLQGKAACFFRTGHTGFTKHIHYHTQSYSSCKRTVYGTVHKTAVIRNAGANAIFGPPWSPEEGVVLIGVPPDTEHLIFRVMDYDWGKKDDLLGEVVVDIRQYLNQPKVELQLHRKGKPERSHVEFNIAYAENYDQRDINDRPLKGIHVRLFKAVNLPSGDWFGKNDVYVQVYAAPPGAPPPMNQALPEPNAEMTLPVGQFNVPFSFQLPRDLPSSMVSVSGEDYVMYSVYANIDVACRADPSTRCFFTVLQHQNPSLYVTPAEKTDGSFIINTQYIIPPFCCESVSCSCCGSFGKLACKMTTPRSSYSPGETAHINLEFSSSWPDFSTQWRSITVSFKQTFLCWANGRKYTYTRALTEPSVHKNQGDVPAGPVVSKDIPFVIPICPPTYTGGLERSDWLGEVSRYGGLWAMNPLDPVTWSYSVVLELQLGLPGCSCDDKRVVYMFPIKITAVNACAFEGLSRGVDLVSIVRRKTYRPELGLPFDQLAMASAQSHQQQVMEPVQAQVMLRGMPEASVTPIASVIPELQPSRTANYDSGGVEGCKKTPASDNGNQLNTHSNPDNAKSLSEAFNAPNVNDPRLLQEYRTEDYQTATEANTFFAYNVSLVESTTKRVMRDFQDDFTVKNDDDLMYCPVYFKFS